MLTLTMPQNAVTISIMVPNLFRVPRENKIVRLTEQSKEFVCRKPHPAPAGVFRQRSVVKRSRLIG
jgi:hypothetical protein